MSIEKCSRRMWQSLQRLDAAMLEERLEPYMSQPERAAVVARQQDLIALIRELIEREGEEDVLFSYDDPGSVIAIRE